MAPRDRVPRTGPSAGPSAGRAAGLVAALVAGLGAAGGCSGPPPVAPLPIEAPASLAPSPSASSPVASSPASPSLSASPSPSPARRTRPPSTPPAGTLDPACEGAVIYTIPSDTELALMSSLCFALGAILRVEGGPGTVTADPDDHTTHFYEGGITQLRFVRTGTVIVRIVRAEQTYRVTVVIR